eukprot:gene5687-8679_t
MGCCAAKVESPERASIAPTRKRVAFSTNESQGSRGVLKELESDNGSGSTLHEESSALRQRKPSFDNEDLDRKLVRVASDATEPQNDVERLATQQTTMFDLSGTIGRFVDQQITSEACSEASETSAWNPKGNKRATVAPPSRYAPVKSIYATAAKSSHSLCLSADTVCHPAFFSNDSFCVSLPSTSTMRMDRPRPTNMPPAIEVPSNDDLLQSSIPPFRYQRSFSSMSPSPDASSASIPFNSPALPTTPPPKNQHIPRLSLEKLPKCRLLSFSLREGSIPSSREPATRPQQALESRDAAPLGSASQDISEAGEVDNGNREVGGVGAQGATRPRHPQAEAPTGDPEDYPEHPDRSPID